ncbi:MAG: carbamate kinase [Terriglobales bacterium]
MTETLVIALGGNAITRPGERGTIPQQFAHTAETLEHMMPLFRSDRRIVITHGNGPQIGNILIRSEEGERRVPPLPLDTCVSDSQGGMGYMIQRVADEMFRREGIRRECATVITQVVVDRNDPDFKHPSKPVGSFYSAEHLGMLKAEKPHWRMKEIEPGRWRRVVPSPRPLDILEKDSIAAMLQAGVIVVACGGGGIPVAWEKDRLVGVEGVIDKDFASCLLAKQVRAHKLIIVTSVDQVALSYRKPQQQWLTNVGIDDLKKHLAAGEFPAGSMGPKVEAAIDFIENGGEECVITSTEKCAEAVEGSAGTHIVAAWGNRSLTFSAP